MAVMQPLVPSLLALALLAAACLEEERSAASPSPHVSSPSMSASPSPSPSQSPTAGPRPIPPAWATPIEDSIPASDIPTQRLAPPDAEITGTWLVPAAAGILDQIAVAWAIGDDPFAREHGLAVWQSFDEPPAWSVVLAFVDGASRGVLGIRAELGDVTADGHDDVLSFEDTGGSGACGIWRVLATVDGAMRELYDEQTCDTNVAISEGTLVVTEAVFRADDAHCCPSATRTTTLEWDGAKFLVVDRFVTEN